MTKNALNGTLPCVQSTEVECLTIRHLKMQQLINELVKNDKWTLYTYKHNSHATLI